MRHDVTVDEWVEALESGRYQHGTGGLHWLTVERSEFCCMGVLCDIAGGTWQNTGMGDFKECPEVNGFGVIATNHFHLFGPEFEVVLAEYAPRLIRVNENSREGYTPVVKALRQIQEEVA